MMRISLSGNNADELITGIAANGAVRDLVRVHALHLSGLDNVTSVPRAAYLSDNLTTDDDASELLSSKRRPIGGEIITIVIIIILAIIGNVVMICAVLKTPYLRTVTNLFTINLAVSDLGIALLVMPMWIASMALAGGATVDESPIPKPLCEATAFVTVLLLLVSIATLSGISLDRYFSICHPLRYPREVTPRRVYCVLVYIWIQSVFLSMIPLLGWGRYRFRPQTIPICNPEWSSHVTFSAFLAIVGLIIPFSAMLFSYIRIIQEARKQSKRIENIQLRLVTPSEFDADESLLRTSDAGTPDVSRRPSLLEWIKGRPMVHKHVKSYTTTFSRNLKTLKTVFIVVGAFFVCWGPYVLLNAWYVNSNTSKMPYEADLVTTLLVLSNAAVNPFVFISLTRDFRYAVRLLLIRCLEYTCPDDAGSGISGRRSSRHRDSMAEALRVTPRASFDSGVVMDRDQYGSPRRSTVSAASCGSSTGGGGMHRVHSTVTIRCDSIESDDDEMEHVGLASTSQGGGYGTTTLLVPGQAVGGGERDIFSAEPIKKPVFVSQFGPTLKPPDPFRFQFERPITPRLPSAKSQEVEKQKIYTTTSCYGAIGNGTNSTEDRRTNGSLNGKQPKGELPQKNVVYDRRIPILILPDDDSG